jgi:hypothetical protein
MKRLKWEAKGKSGQGRIAIQETLSRRSSWPLATFIGATGLEGDLGGWRGQPLMR